MSNKSFGMICDDWKSKNDGYELDWSYNMEGPVFEIELLLSGTELDGVTVSSKAELPDSYILNPFAVELALNVLKTQIELYTVYGIKI